MGCRGGQGEGLGGGGWGLPSPSRRQGCFSRLPSYGAHCSPNKASSNLPFTRARLGHVPSGAGKLRVPPGALVPPRGWSSHGWGAGWQRYIKGFAKTPASCIHPHKGSRPSAPAAPAPSPPLAGGATVPPASGIRSHSELPGHVAARCPTEHPSPAPRAPCWKMGGPRSAMPGVLGVCRGRPGAHRRRARSGRRTPGVGWVRACSKACRNSGEFFCVYIFQGCLTLIRAWAAPCGELPAFLLCEGKSCAAKQPLKNQ